MSGGSRVGPVGTAARSAPAVVVWVFLGTSMLLCRRRLPRLQVMAFPSVILRRRDAVGRHRFESIDRLDAQGREPPRSFYRAA